MNASHLYWTGSGDGTVNQANLDGTGQQALVTAQPTPRPVADRAGSNLYWTSNVLGTIFEADLDGNGIQTPVTGQTDLEGVAVSPASG